MIKNFFVSAAPDNYSLIINLNQIMHGRLRVTPNSTELIITMSDGLIAEYSGDNAHTLLRAMGLPSLSPTDIEDDEMYDPDYSDLDQDDFDDDEILITLSEGIAEEYL
jgi:hypothetical protein